MPNEIKAIRRDLPLFFLLIDICYLNLSRIESHSLIADRLIHTKLLRAKHSRKKKDTLRKKVTAALNLLNENPDRVAELIELVKSLANRGKSRKLAK